MKKPRKRTTLKEDVGKALLDAGKLIFGSIFLGCILLYEIPRDILFAGGFVFAIVFHIVGLILGKREIKTDKTVTHKRKGERDERFSLFYFVCVYVRSCIDSLGPYIGLARTPLGVCRALPILKKCKKHSFKHFYLAIRMSQESPVTYNKQHTRRCGLHRRMIHGTAVFLIAL